jgi:hypothetical protein
VRTFESSCGCGSSVNMSEISLQELLEAVADFDGSGGGSIALAAWDLCVDEQSVVEVWRYAVEEGLIAPARPDEHEVLWRLTPAGWLAHDSGA